jgi:AraC-like DNA-binding protein
VDDSQAEPTGTLFLTPGRVLFVGRNLNSDLHHHFGASITVSLEGPLRYREPDGDWIESKSCLAQSNAEFALSGGTALLVNLQLDVEKGEVHFLGKAEPSHSPLSSLPDDVVETLRDRLRAHLSTPQPSGRELQHMLLSALHDGPFPKAKFDVRITRVLALLKDSLPQMPSAAEIAEEVGLSEGRLIHLFRAQLGVPLRRYIMWLRIRYLMFFWGMGHNLTDAAHAAGFADSAHFSRIYRGMYGFPPSKMLRSDKITIVPESYDPDPDNPNYERDQQLMKRMLEDLAQGANMAKGAGLSQLTPSSRAGRRGDP